MNIYAFRPGNPALGKKSDQVIVSLGGFLYVCTIPVAVLCSFLLLVTPSSLICTFSSPFLLCRLVALG